VFYTWRGMQGWCFMPGEGCWDGVLYLERDARMVFYTWRGMPGWCFIPGEGRPDGVGSPDLAVDENVEDCQEGEGEEVKEDQVQPVDVHLHIKNTLNR
jgi:hypothetical protein